MLKLLLIALLWTVYGCMLVRALMQRDANNRFRPQVWYLFFLGCVAFTFTGQEIELTTDQFFGGLPVSVYIKYFALTLIAYLYCTLMHTIKPITASTLRALRLVNWLAIGVGLVSFGLLVLSDIRFHPDTRYYVHAARDSIVTINMVWVIIPHNVSLFKIEQVPTMRIKHILNTLLCSTYVLVAVTSVISLIIVVFRLDDINRWLPIFLPLTYLVYFFFLWALVPHRWVAFFLYPARLYAYLRLRCLQRDVERLAELHMNLNIMPARWTLGELEFAIYQCVIFILDHASLIQPSDDKHHLAYRLSRVLRKEMDYPTLVRSLTRLRYARSST
ncbi:MAG: hypothetical protein SF123_04195 [Chloroflexota bacterium]|nr:hypothetical protein [Chloroflexota bacterium]